MKKYYCLFFVMASLILSCIRKEDCKIQPITPDIIDLSKLKGDFIYENQKGEIDSLILSDYSNVIRNQTISSLANHKLCGHFIGFDYAYKNEAIGFTLKKTEKHFEFSVNGFCVSKDISMNEYEVKSDSLFVINIEKCDKSDFKILAFRKFKLEYFITQNGDIWKPIKFIPKD